jgi:DNA ligase-4
VALVKPEIGVKVGRAEFVKAQSCKHAIAQAKGRMMMMERKYDGEYCQVSNEYLSPHPPASRVLMTIAVDSHRPE